MSWQDAAVCAQVGTEVFFPEVGSSPRKLKQICAGCPVAKQCLDYAIENQIRYGIWGGLTALERSKLARGLRREEAA